MIILRQKEFTKYKGPSIGGLLTEKTGRVSKFELAQMDKEFKQNPKLVKYSNQPLSKKFLNGMRNLDEYQDMVKQAKKGKVGPAAKGSPALKLTSRGNPLYEAIKKNVRKKI